MDCGCRRSGRGGVLETVSMMLAQQAGLGAAVAVFPSLDPADYTAAGQACPWYSERKAAGSVVSCQFPSNTAVAVGAVAAVGLILLLR